MSKYRITVEGKTYEMDVELIGANGAVQPVAKVESKPAVSAPKPLPHPQHQSPLQLQQAQSLHQCPERSLRY